MPKRPNVLFIIADDHRAGAIGAHGDPVVQTPVLDRLVEQGTTFRQNHHMGGRSGAVCVPTRACLLTGANVFRAMDPDYSGDQQYNYGIHPDLPMLPEVFRTAGYRTFATGKWHNDRESFARAFGDGDKIFFGGMSDHDAVPVHDYDPDGEFPDEDSYTGEEFSTDLFANAAVRFLDEQDDEEPFFLYLAFTAPHDPRTPPSKYAGRYDPDEIELPPNVLPGHPFDNGEMHVRDEELAPFPRPPEEIRRHMADYYGMISHMDDRIGRVLDALEANGFAEDTVVVYTADHGLAVGQHGLMGKQNLYDHSVRVPLILSGPDVPTGHEVDALTQTYDLYPTLCDMAGVSIPDSVESESLVPVLDGEEDGETHREVVCAVYRDVQRMISDGEWKLIRYYRSEERDVGTDHSQLFHLTDDPWEIQDLSGVVHHQERVGRLAEQLTQWQRKVGDPLFREA